MVHTKKDLYFRNIVGVKDSNRNCDFTKSLDPLWISLTLTPFDLGINLFYQDHIYDLWNFVRGHSTTMWTEFCHFFDPLRGKFLYPEDKNRLF